MDTDYILELIQGNKVQRKKGIDLIVKDKTLKAKLMSITRNKGASASQALDIYHDVVMAIVKAALKRKPIKNLESYAVGIAKFKWYDMLKKSIEKKVENHSIENHEPYDYTTMNVVLKGERAELLKKILLKLNRNCKAVLLLWGSGYNMTEIADRLQYKSAGMARKKKSHCLKSLLEYLEANPSIKESLQS